MTKYHTGALTPPDFYAAQEAAARKIAAATSGYIDYQLVAGFDGMAIRVNFDTEANCVAAWKQFGGILRTVEQTGMNLKYASVDGVEVFFSG